MKAVSLSQNSNGEFVLTYENGALSREDSEIAFAKHNLLCFGRLNRNLTQNPVLRRGSLLSFLENREVYSSCWLYFLEGNTTLEVMKKMIIEFNRACDRDFNAGLFERRIVLKSITKLDKNTLFFKIQIGTQDQELSITF